jgi:thiamine kinase-like enzyme
MVAGAEKDGLDRRPDETYAPPMAAGLDSRLDALLDTIPCTARRPRTVVDLAGGLTNRNLKVTTPDGTVVVRIPGAGPALLGIDRDHEHTNSVAAAAAGVGAPVRHYRPGEGLVVDFLPGTALTDDGLHDPAVLERVARACRRLHAGPRFVNEFDMFEVRARYRRIVAEHGFRLPPRYDEFAPAVERIRDALGPRDHTVPCNNDLLAGNLLDDGERIRIIDYEYSGNNDPCFELGNVWSEATLPLPLLEVLVTAYFGRPRPAQVARARLFGLVAKYGWMLWASIQDGSSPLDFDFWSWGMEKYDRAVAEFDGPDLERLLAAARQSDPEEPDE